MKRGLQHLLAFNPYGAKSFFDSLSSEPERQPSEKFNELMRGSRIVPRIAPQETFPVWDSFHHSDEPVDYKEARDEPVDMSMLEAFAKHQVDNDVAYKVFRAFFVRVFSLLPYDVWEAKHLTTYLEAVLPGLSSGIEVMREEPFSPTMYMGSIYLSTENSLAPTWLHTHEAFERGCNDLVDHLLHHAESLTTVAIQNSNTVEIFKKLTKAHAKLDKVQTVFLETSKLYGEFEELHLVFEYLRTLPSLQRLVWVCHNKSPEMMDKDVPQHASFPLIVELGMRGVDVKVVSTFHPRPTRPIWTSSAKKIKTCSC